MVASPDLDDLCRALAEMVRKHGLVTQRQSDQLLSLVRREAPADQRALRRLLESSPHIAPGLRHEFGKILKTPNRKRFGDFTVVGHLADGGMGDVWMAIGRNGEMGVVKTLLPELANDAEFLLRFEREAEITVGMDNPFLVRSLGHGQSDEGSLYLALEYVPGGDLFNLVAHVRRLDEDAVLRILRQVGIGLDAAHGVHLVHRDIKPENILISTEGDARLVDFGLARTTLQDRTVLTMAGSTLGTPDYMSPEQICGEADLDIRSDLYALGAVAFFCLAGEPPFTGDSIDVMKQHLERPPRNLAKLGRCSRRCADLVARCMAKRPENRFQTPADLVEEIEDLLGPESIHGTGGIPQDLAREALPAAEYADMEVIDLTGDGTNAGAIGTKSELVAMPVDLIDDDLSGIPADPATPALQPRACVETETTSSPAHDWIILRGRDRAQGAVVHCLARERIVVGKSRAAPVDICLRCYPRHMHDKTNGRISRQHFSLRYDRERQRFLLQDLDSTNGTILDGQKCPAKQELPLFRSQTHRLAVPKSMNLLMRVIGNALEDRDGVGGVLLKRLGNATHIKYCQVVGEVPIGTGDDTITVKGAELPAALWLRYGPAGWEWRPDDGVWRELALGDTITATGCTFDCEAGDYEAFR